MSAMVWVVLGLAGVGLALGLPLTWLALTLGRRSGALDSSGAPGHGKALRALPNTGGIAIVLAVAGPVLAGLAAVGILDDETLVGWLGALGEEDRLDRIRQTMPAALAMIAGMAVIHLLGIVDDRRSLAPWLKLAVEIGVATVMAVWFEVRLLELLGPVPSVVVTVFWIVTVTNAINFLDNMDGLAAGVSGIAAALLMAACLVNQQWFVAATLALLVGSLSGFLVFNFPPAKVFMGDGGSLAVGFLLAVLTARTTYYDPALGGGWYAVFMPLVILAIPLYDLTSVTLIRIVQGRHPFVGDQQHFSHRLVQRGLSPRGAVILIWAATAVTGLPGVALGRLAGWQAILVGAQVLLVLLMLAILEYASRRAASGARP